MILHELSLSDHRSRSAGPAPAPYNSKRANPAPPGASRDAPPSKQHQQKTQVLDKGYQSITLGEESSIPSVHYTTKNIKSFTPPMDSDPRRQKAAIIFPRDIARHPDMFRIHNLKLDMTWKGRDCYSCTHVSGSHNLTNVKLVVMGDQYLPANIGSGTQCVPIIRIEDGSFEAIKQALWSQRNMGFRTVEGALYAVSLQSYLCRAGSERFWNDFENLETWVREKMGGVLAPFFMPYGLLDDEMLSKMQQCVTVMRARYLGCQGGRPQWRFSLWQPLYNFFTENGVVRRAVHVPVSMVKMEDGTTQTIESAQRAYQGVLGEFDKNYPEDFEIEFIPKLMRHIEENAPPVMLPIVPPIEALEKGFLREDDNASILIADKPTLYLYGNSIMRETGKYIDENNLAVTHDLTMNCRGGDIISILKDHPIPATKNSQDIAVLHFLGNMSLRYTKYGKPDQNWHYLHPKILEDSDVSALVDKIIAVVGVVRKTYAGTLKIIGPFPRLVGECCEDPEHRLSPPFPFSASPLNAITSYYAAVNQYLVCHPKLAGLDAEIIPYQLIWYKKGGFGLRSLRDNLHLKEEATKIFADFLVKLPAWKTKSYKLMELDSAFKTWAALYYGWGKKKDDAPSAPSQQKDLTAAGPPTPPSLPPLPQEDMDQAGPSSTVEKEAESQETISQFLEKNSTNQRTNTTKKGGGKSRKK